MKNSRRIVTGLITATVLATMLSGTGVLANTVNDGTGLILVDDAGEELENIEPYEWDGEVPDFSVEDFRMFVGKIESVTDYEPQPNGEGEGWKFVLVKGEQDELMNFLVTDNTCFMNENPLEEGAVLTGFYNINVPALMIYPPQYKVDVVSVDQTAEESIFVGRFDEHLTDLNNNLKLNISDDTEIIYQNGDVFEGELSELHNRKLAVVYTFSTRSIPAQTTPSKVVVLYEKAVPVAPEYGDPTLPQVQPPVVAVQDMPIVVNGNEITAPQAFENENGTVMIPLRAVSDALGFKVEWNNQLRMVTMNTGITMTIGEDKYVYMRTPIITLGAAPVIVNDRTFVPLNFFNEVIRSSNAFVSDGRIVINNF